MSTESVLAAPTRQTCALGSSTHRQGVQFGAKSEHGGGVRSLAGAEGPEGYIGCGRTMTHEMPTSGVSYRYSGDPTTATRGRIVVIPVSDLDKHGV